MSRYKSDRIEPKGATLEQEFDMLMTWLSRDAGHSSRMKDRYEHPAFAEIVTHGREMLPFILKRELSWVEFGLLTGILGGGPEIPEESRGRLYEIRAIYEKWLKDQGF